ncbi:MAG: class I SAM-dependent methyltransferase [Treponema sp.]|uniref:class I SAM-dependent methyltransferase n=1 Tax=Treponema sp. TaxID=166 RepID=UPI00298DAD15|nr:class I SAM-dependent methyltransferase [Treponema sp.]MBR5932669.1 class I SAM-dependent methyltransferase [Treponema sp.]
MTNLEKYYNKFNEDHRLTTRHGTVEFTTSIKYIHESIEEIKKMRSASKDEASSDKIKILDVGAGTGRYSIALSKEGYDVTAVELVERNLKVLESKHEKVKCWPGNAMDLSFLDDDVFDITLLFGPIYHLMTEEEKLKAFSEAKRVTKSGGRILVSYVMNDYSVLTYCFKQNKIKECIERESLTDDFHQIVTPDDLYSYLRLEDIDRLNEITGLKRIKIIAADGAADYMRRELNALDEESFNWFIRYHLANCERPELLGASSHVVDVLLNEK